MTTVAACQVPLRVGDVEGNRGALRQAVQEAAAARARIIVLPELANSGYVFADADEARSLAEPVGGPTVTAWAAWAREYGAVICGGFCERGDDGTLYNAAVLTDGSGVRAHYRKAHLWDREKLVFTPGDTPPPLIETDEGRIGVMICYDLEFPEWVRLAALRGADLLCLPTNWPHQPRPAGERPMEIVRTQAGAAVNRIFIVAADRVGEERGVDWVGGSVVVDPDGWPIGGARRAYGGLIVADCPLGEARDKRISERNDVHADRRPQLYGDVASAS